MATIREIETQQKLNYSLYKGIDFSYVGLGITIDQLGPVVADNIRTVLSLRDIGLALESVPVVGVSLMSGYTGASLPLIGFSISGEFSPQSALLSSTDPINRILARLIGDHGDERHASIESFVSIDQAGRSRVAAAKTVLPNEMDRLVFAESLATAAQVAHRLKYPNS